MNSCMLLESRGALEGHVAPVFRTCVNSFYSVNLANVSVKMDRLLGNIRTMRTRHLLYEMTEMNAEYVSNFRQSAMRKYFHVRTDGFLRLLGAQITSIKVGYSIENKIISKQTLHYHPRSKSFSTYFVM